MIKKNLSVFIVVILLNLFASGPTLTTGYETACVKPKTISLCKLDSTKHNFIGKTGEKGDKGPKGDDGRDGLKGDPGKDGYECTNGTDGTNGMTGISGAKGDTGPKGPPGYDGVNGLQGHDGEKGAKGEPGIPGTPGSCGCKSDSIVTESHFDYVKWAGDKDKPGNVTCRDAPISESDHHYLYLDKFEVFCEFETNKTCVKHLIGKNISYTQSKSFWLSEKGVSLKDIYNLNSDQLSWLQRESSIANMTIRYHCLNSIPYEKDSANTSVVLLSWNDIMVGPDSTTALPFHYTVPESKDGCSKARNDEWSSTDIELDSPIAQRLPIIDFFIRDVRNESQALRIEIVNLCFG